MPRTGKLILVKEPGAFPRLRPATALGIDGASGQVILDQALPLADGASQTVPRDWCYEFDPEVMDAVNGLVVSAQDKLNAAGQIAALELQPAQIETPEDEDLIFH